MVTSFMMLRNNVGVDSDNICRSQSSYEVFDFTESGKRYKSSDFDVQSLLSVGAYDLLQPAYVSSLSSMQFADRFQNLTISKSE